MDSSQASNKYVNAMYIGKTIILYDTYVVM